MPLLCMYACVLKCLSHVCSVILLIDRSIRTTYCLQRLAWDSEMEPAMLIPRSTT